MNGDTLDVVFGRDLTVEWCRRSTGGIDFHFVPRDGGYRAVDRGEVEQAVNWSGERGVGREDWPIYLTEDHREIPLEELKRQNAVLLDRLGSLLPDASAPSFMGAVAGWLQAGKIICILPGVSP